MAEIKKNDMKKTKQIILCLTMLLSVGVWGQTKTVIKDTVFVKSKKEFNRIIKNVIPPNTPNSRCFTYTIKNEGGNTPNGGYWVSKYTEKGIEANNTKWLEFKTIKLAI